MFCKYCGNKIEDDSIYCSHCGKYLQSNLPDSQITIQPTEVEKKDEQNSRKSQSSKETATDAPTPPKKRNLKTYIDWINTLDMETKADLRHEGVVRWKYILVSTVGLSIAIYYLCGNNLLFNVLPFWGFVLYLLFTGVLLIIMYVIGDKYWEIYNEIIDKARNDIDEIIKKGIGSEEDLTRLKKHQIERKLNDLVFDDITEEEFKWHSSRYCWGCGRPHVNYPYWFTYTRVRDERWEDGFFKYKRTFRCSAQIYVCWECQKKFTSSSNVGKTKWSFDKIPTINSFLKKSVDELLKGNYYY